MPRFQLGSCKTGNRIEAIDPAIRRPGRFDYHIELSLPNAAGRRTMLEVHVRNVKIGSDIDLSEIAAKTEGWSGAEIALLCREAGLAAIHRGLEAGISADELAVKAGDIENALQEIARKRVDLSVSTTTENGPRKQ